MAINSGAINFNWNIQRQTERSVRFAWANAALRAMARKEQSVNPVMYVSYLDEINYAGKEKPRKIVDLLCDIIDMELEATWYIQLEAYMPGIP